MTTVKGVFTLNDFKKIEVELKPINDLYNENAPGDVYKVETNSDKGFSISIDVRTPALYLLSLRVGEGNNLSGYFVPVYLTPQKNLELQFTSYDQYHVKCNYKDITDDDNRSLISMNEICNSLQRDNFLNPPRDSRAVTRYLDRYWEVCDSVLSQAKIAADVEKYIKFFFADKHCSSLYNSSVRDLSRIRTEFFNDVETLLFPSGIQNFIYFLNLKSGLNVYARKKTIEQICEQIDMMGSYTDKTAIVDEAIKSLLESYIISYKSNGDFEKERQKFNLVADKIKNPDISAELKTRFSDLKYIIPGSPVPLVVLEDRDGKSITLDSFYGKFLVIDIWATWCVPCVKMIPYLKEQEHYFEGKNVVFASICISSEKANWQKKLKDLQLNGNDYFDFTSGLKNSLNINSVPHYLIYGPDGKLLVYKADMPDSAAFRERLDALIGVK
jgi:thiol-disulfide isomerase/thioredoxin